MRKLELQKTDNRDDAKQKESAMNAKPKSILEAFEYIVELAEDSNLDEDFFAKAAIHVRYASRKLKLTAPQTVLLALFVDRRKTAAS